MYPVTFKSPETSPYDAENFEQVSNINRVGEMARKVSLILSTTVSNEKTVM